MHDKSKEYMCGSSLNGDYMAPLRCAGAFGK